MLKSLHINNIALIKNVEIEFSGGLTVLSGETGAGKSIIIDSLIFILGGKADKSLIKHGEASLKVEALFEIDDGQKVILEENGIDAEDNQLLISRTMSLDGKQDCRINGKLAIVGMLKNITSHLVDIYGQGEHQSILKTANHLHILDNFDRNIKPVSDKVSELFSQYKSLNKEILNYGGSEEERLRNIDLLSFQVEEISKAGLKQSEEDELIKQKSKAVNLTKILDATSTGIEMIDEREAFSSNSAIARINKARHAIVNVVKFEETFDGIAERLKSTEIELQDIAEELKIYFEKNSSSIYDLEKIEKRLDKYKELKRKYGKSIDDINAFFIKATKELDNLKNSEEKLNELNIEKERILKLLYNNSSNLSSLRRAAAAEFEKAIKSQLDELGMKGALFEVKFNKFPDFESIQDLITAHGLDTAEFYFSANKGEPLKPLSKIISGGEMSRFMLALKCITSNIGNIQTMIFDEIDTGISGKIGTAVACKLAKISRGKQVLAITHLPAIAAMADNQILVYKNSDKNQTNTYIKILNENEMITEISRLVGGKEISTVSLEHSAEIKKWSNEFKQKMNI